GRFYWLSGLRRSCFVVNQTMAAKASYQKANKIRSYGVIFRAVGISSCRDGPHSSAYPSQIAAKMRRKMQDFQFFL
ncbi:MAG: hypothetical protein OIF54_15840, partial [Cohaesibacter sp.]|nr:hypothetical protein [Cohaesibacter sp.]